MPDLSFYPESYLVENALEDPVEFGRSHAEEIARLVDVADLSLLPFTDARAELEKALASSNPWERYWALIVCSCFGNEAKEVVPRAAERLEDPEPMVRVRAAEFLGIVGTMDPRPTLYEVLNTTDSPVEAQLTFNTAAFFHDRTPDRLPFEVQKLDMRVKGGELGRRIGYFKGQ
jgi:HEAT repeat protein